MVLLVVCLFEGLAQWLRCPVVSEEAEGSLHLFFHIVYNEYVSDVTYRVKQPLLLGKEVYNEYVSDVTYRVKRPLLLGKEVYNEYVSDVTYRVKQPLLLGKEEPVTSPSLLNRKMLTVRVNFAYLNQIQ